jgi:hypothetical protein
MSGSHILREHLMEILIFPGPAVPGRRRRPPDNQADMEAAAEAAVKVTRLGKAEMVVSAVVEVPSVA